MREQKPIPRVIWLLAGEASGDVLGARLMQALHAADPHLAFVGVGGTRMEALGLQSLFPMHELALMGLVEVLPRLRSLSRRLNEAALDIERRQPTMIVTIDSPGFALRLLKRIRHLDIPRVHYVAPQVWAWREKRVKEFPGLWDRLLCLLPFEAEWFAERGIEAQFVGHPVLQSEADKGDAQRFRTRHDIPEGVPILVLMPGSRRSEVPRLLPVFGQMLTLLKRRLPDIRPVIPVSPIVAPTVRAAVADWPVQPCIVTDLHDKHDAFAAAGAALTKSGTSTLELALARVPMAVTYRVNPLTAFIVRRLIRVPFVAMINLLARRGIVPELLQEQCRPSVLAKTVETLLCDPAVADAQRQAFGDVLAQLRPPSDTPRGGTAADAAAAAILELMNQGPVAA
ncbi:lipid-A-disaccharide synthase [Neoasaia chiangmaiensis NBRC 101099]|uniref:Lipid-A-disaccharide synthase n=1 Tax=Neoasaia chiangmaiensis TaxID=320497 RepID=A0A1U9KN38_9PROT|nr:lipid-A-disaccharide synthase [Neoasaia chiangmaiensis]AQS87178.1 lipid-A-disaccharide synthase [Neoasaia chiangmaiensis]GBR38240.1 lipid-A-disaccharide synthase [Neoasaia chiangmaiensis NBRC 101099]GEN15975.1 lipid-A-disaccharide synthase [Neoasaia chiangmaiensis]